MNVSVYLPLIATVLLAAFGPRLARRLPPMIATGLLTAGAALAAATSTASLALLAVRFVAQVPLIASTGHWSRDVLADGDPADGLAGMVAIVAILVLLPFAIRAGRRLWRETARTHELILAFADQPATMTVVVDPRPQAFAVPGLVRRPGRAAIPSRVVVTDSLLRTLDPTQRRAMLAHEQSHLARRHHLYLLLTGVAAVVNPLLGRLPEAVAEATERWADEDAAAAVGNRTIVATALGHAALSGLTAPLTLPAMAQAHVGVRVRALMAPPPPRRHLLTAAVAAAFAMTAFAALESVHDTDQLFDAAQAAWHATHQPTDPWYRDFR